MTEKLLMLRGVGLFENGLDAPVTLGKFNVLYADNGRGKSTFSDIMRSLITGDGASIVGRKTIQGSFEPEVKLLCDKTECHFINGKWSKTIPSIVVFDSIFVDANVYSGTQVDADHRKNLHRFALGEKGVDLAQEVEKLNQDIPRQSKADHPGNARGGKPSLRRTGHPPSESPAEGVCRILLQQFPAHDSRLCYGERCPPG